MCPLTLSPQATAVLDAHYGLPGVLDGIPRLPASTRRLAAHYLSGDVGATMARSAFSPDEAGATLPLSLRYAASIQLIARHAPLRLDPEEWLVGSATLLEACWHQTPASSITISHAGTLSYLQMVDDQQAELAPISSTSHITIDYPKVLRVGYRGLRAQMDARLARGGLEAAQTDYLTAMRQCLEAAQTWHQRYVQALETLYDTTDAVHRPRVAAVLAAMRHVPEAPPTTFHEAVQSLWFCWTFQRLCGNWTGLGRVDEMLGPFLRRDMADGRITLDEARDILAHFWIKGSEWIGAPSSFGHGSSGDAQYYQNVILGGIDIAGAEITNEVTYLILDIVEELHISDFPIAVRVSERTAPLLWERIAQVQRLGGGIVSIYNEDLVMRALTRFGFSLEEARTFTNDGCWEVLIPGKSAFGYYPFDTLQLLQETLGVAETGELPTYARFDDLYAAFRARLATALAAIAADTVHAFNHPQMTAPLLSLLVDDCIDTAHDYHQRGAKYTMRAPHAGGLPDVANSLHVIQRAVYQEGRTTLRTLITAMRQNWNGYEDLQRQLMQDYVLYGNADPEADAMMQRVFNDYVTLAAGMRESDGVLCPPGISTFGREIGWRNQRQATAFGRPAHAILASNLAPTPGSERHGMTAVVRSFCSLDFERLPNGVPLDLNLSPSSLAGENGLRALVALLQTFMRLGGWYLQINVIDRATLQEAQRHPERFPNLVVRISGWSARFATLDVEWQEMVIQRAVGLG